MTNNIIIPENYSMQLLEPEKDYSRWLEKYEMQHTKEDFYLIYGSVIESKSWRFYLSVVASQIPQMLELVLPILKQKDIPFRLAGSNEIAIEIQAGYLGLSEIGKVITIYPGSENQALALVSILRDKLKGFYGPKVLSAARLDGVIYAGYGDLDSIPFHLPKDLRWPFGSIVTYNKQEPVSVLGGKYKVIGTIKEDAKGFVWQGVFLKNLVKATACVIKEGRAFMMYDDHERDIRDRIQWQFKLHKELAELVSLPKVYDHFRENGNSYLVLEYIDGRQLDSVITEIYQQRTWHDLSSNERLRLINFGIQVVENISTMHQRGIVHRDITSGNFLVTTRDRIVLIDLELAYSLKEQRPNPPFIMGTEGFMSPEQQAVQIPTVSEDIYAIGATLLVLFTGILPTKFETAQTDTILEQLSYLIPEDNITNLISSCLSPSVVYRSGLAEIKPALEELREGILNSKDTVAKKVIQNTSRQGAEDLIQKAIKGLMLPSFVTAEGLWYSKPYQDRSTSYAQVTERAIYGGFSSGQAGILYLLAKAKHCSLDVKPCLGSYYKALGYLQENYLKNGEQVDGGLYHGSAGIGLAAADGIKAGLLANSPAAIQNIEACYSSQNIFGFGLNSGAAGQGLAILQCRDIISPSFADRRLQGLINFLLEHQQKDGSWISGKEKLDDFDNGMGGIVKFLLEYFSQYQDKKVEQSILLALGWLEQNKAAKTEEKLAFTFLKANKILGRQEYLNRAGQIFNTIPERISNRDLSQATGLAGLGEIYLNAAEILDSRQLRQRADWIAGVLLHQYRQAENGSVFWQVDDSSSTTADFMTGNAGIIHFLLRWLHMGKFTHPLLS